MDFYSFGVSLVLERRSGSVNKEQHLKIEYEAASKAKVQLAILAS